MSRAFCIPGLFFILGALALNILVCVPPPAIPWTDIARTDFANGAIGGNITGLKEIRFGIWTPCYYDSHDNQTCPPVIIGHAYNVTITNQKNSSQVAVVDASWIRGLIIHPAAAGVTLIALLFSFSTHKTVTLIASIVSFVAAFLTLVAFVADIALFAHAQLEMQKLGEGITTKVAPGFLLTFASVVLLFLASCTIFCGHRRDSRPILTGMTTVTTNSVIKSFKPGK